MNEIRFFHGAQIWAKNGSVILKMQETPDGMLLIEICDPERRVQIGMEDEQGISFRFADELLRRQP